MELGNPIEALTNALIDALGHRLPDIEYQWQTPMDRKEGKPLETKHRRPEMRDIAIWMFPETWASTALGFGGIGGAAITCAYTTVIQSDNLALLYWDGVYAYAVEPDEVFMTDVRKGSTMEHASAHTKYKMVDIKP